MTEDEGNTNEDNTTVRLNPEVKAKWVAALRSGKYRQGKDYLCTQERGHRKMYCCLGVLCELAVEAGVLTKREDAKASLSDLRITTYGVGTHENSSCFVPPAGAAWAGCNVNTLEIRLDDGFGVGSPLDRTLPALNDRFGWTFEEIANLIEEHL